MNANFCIIDVKCYSQTRIVGGPEQNGQNDDVCRRESRESGEGWDGRVEVGMDDGLLQLACMPQLGCTGACGRVEGE